MQWFIQALAYWFLLIACVVIWMVLRKNKYLDEKYTRDVPALQREVEFWRHTAELLQSADARRPHKPRKKKNVNVNAQGAAPYGERTGVRKIRIGT